VVGEGGRFCGASRGRVSQAVWNRSAAWSIKNKSARLPLRCTARIDGQMDGYADLLIFGNAHLHLAPCCKVRSLKIFYQRLFTKSLLQHQNFCHQTFGSWRLAIKKTMQNGSCMVFFFWVGFNPCVYWHAYGWKL
jgi:hypothetical protein